MFILKGQDFSLKVNSLLFSYWDFSNEDNESFEIQTIDGTIEGFNRLVDIDELTDYEDLSLVINDKDFSFTFKFENDVIIINVLELTKTNMLQDKNFTQEILKNIDSNTIDNDQLIKKYIDITFTEFKKLFNLKGTKKYFVDNCPDGFYLTSYNHIRLNKNVRQDKYLMMYECDLGKTN